MSTSSARTVEIVDASTHYEWKQQLIGHKGRVVESKKVESGTVYKVEGLMPGEGIWFAADCLKRIEEDLEEAS